MYAFDCLNQFLWIVCICASAGLVLCCPVDSSAGILLFNYSWSAPILLTDLHQSKMRRKLLSSLPRLSSFIHPQSLYWIWERKKSVFKYAAPSAWNLLQNQLNLRKLSSLNMTNLKWLEGCHTCLTRTATLTYSETHFSGISIVIFLISILHFFNVLCVCCSVTVDFYLVEDALPKRILDLKCISPG